MSNIEDLLDVNQFLFIGDFDDQVANLLSTVRLKRDEVEVLHKLFDDLTATLSEIWPGCEVHPFGSIVTGLGMKNSDVDCYISLPNWIKPDSSHFVMRAKYILSKYPSRFCDLFAIPRAKVPIVKFYHIPTQRNCDINFKSPSGVENSKLLAYLLHLDERWIPLAVLIKFWCKNYNLTGTNLYPNYAMILLIIFYLQKLQVLPSVYELQNSMTCRLVDGWNVAFNDKYNYEKSNNDSLYQLFGGFFDFYSKFNFEENVISPYVGREVKRSAFSDITTIPEEFSLYKFNIGTNHSQKLNTKSQVCIQDPFDHSRNCSGAVYVALFQKFRSLCAKAAEHFAQNANSEFLKLILLKEPSNRPERPISKKKRGKQGRVQKVLAIKQRVALKKQQKMMVQNFFNRRWF